LHCWILPVCVTEILSCPGQMYTWADVEISTTESAPDRLSIDSGRQILLAGTTTLLS